jgi:hypothetical protein
LPQEVKCPTRAAIVRFLAMKIADEYTMGR